MEFAKDLMATLRDRVSPAQSVGSASRIEWAGLHARLAAAHAARRELARGALRDGGFTDWAFMSAGGPNAFRAVNPADSTSGKGPQGIVGAVAGLPQSSGRGQ